LARRCYVPIADPTRPLSVLLVEDQPDVADSLALYLQIACRYRVSVAVDGEAGVAAARADQPDAIICDIGLPKKDGYQVAREVAAALPRRPLLIAVTGYGDDESLAKGRAAGFDHYLLKPADPGAIAEILRTYKVRSAL
jgi:DNA-binding response OmpR family regulator